VSLVVSSDAYFGVFGANAYWSSDLEVGLIRRTGLAGINQTVMCEGLDLNLYF
jgi:hypothetical protein